MVCRNRVLREYGNVSEIHHGDDGLGVSERWSEDASESQGGASGEVGDIHDANGQ
jgi:hypothetical protein